MKKCPFCAESIKDEAIKCRYCQSFLDGQNEDAEDEDAGVESAGSSPAGDDDGWDEVAAESTPRAERKENRPPILLRPEVSQSGASPEPAASPEEGRGRRKVLYSGSPSWRAFFNHYALVTLAAIAVPLLSVWIAGLLEAGWFARTLAVLIPLAFAAVAFMAINFYRRSKIFRVSTTSIESEYGLLSKKIDVLELWRCRDVRYQQSLMDRLLRIAHIEIMTADVTTPQLCINGLPASRQLFEKIRDSIEIQRQGRNVVGFVQ